LERRSSQLPICEHLLVRFGQRPTAEDQRRFITPAKLFV
jgi:hypothetical protein